MSDDQRVYSDEEFALILRKATELTSRVEPTASSSTGLTLAEMQAAAAQVGFDPALVERAAQMLVYKTTASPVERLIGGPWRHDRTAHFPVTLDESGAARLLSAVRISAGLARTDAGHSSALGMTWHDGGDAESLRITARPEEGGTAVSLVLDRRATLGLVAVVSGLAMFFSVLFALSALYPEAPAQGYAGLIVGIGGALAVARGYWASSTRKAQERISAAMNAIAKTLGAVALCLASGFSAWSLHAQTTPSGGTRERALVADTSRAAVRREALERVAQLLGTADTANAVEVLKRAAAASPADARLWHDYGMLLSAWNKPYWRKWSMPAGLPQRFIAADSALARAMWLAPDSAVYALHYGQHLFNSNQWNFANAMRVQAKAVERAEGIADTLTLAQSRDALGMFYWRRYETVARRRFYIMDVRYTPTTLLMRAALNRDLFDNATRAYEPPLGDALYVEAETNFRRARELNIDDELGFRHEAMLLADRERWDEMAAIAGARSKARPAQTWPWFALGIAEHRRGRAGAAHVALDSAYARLPVPERARLSALSRLLPPRSKLIFDTLSALGKAQFEKSYFSLANPTLLAEGNVVWDEFRARVAFAELMWTNEQMNVRGVDSDRGEAVLRWGPPDNVWSLKPDGFGMATLSWLYRGTGFLINFAMAPTYGTAFVSQGERSSAFEPEAQQRPVRWDNVPLFRRGIDSLPVQVARFRHGADSLEIAVFAGIRAGALRSRLPTDTSVLKTGVFAIDAIGDVRTRITEVLRTGERDTMALTARAWRTTVPVSVSYLRVEALETDALRVARAIRDVTGFPTTGFGISDLVIGTGITAPTNADAARWTDYRIAPITGNALRVGRPVDLLWEVYAPTARDGSVQYRVSISVQREERAGLVGVVARLGGRVRDAVIRSSSTDKIAVEYDRTTAVRAQRTESIRLDLGSARAGRYLMTLEVTDLHSGATAITHRDVVLVGR